jgi:hypothetical protein
MHVQFDLGAAQENELAAWHFIKHVSCELGERSRSAHLLRRASKATNILPPKHQSMLRTTYKEHRNIELAGKHFIKYTLAASRATVRMAREIRMVPKMAGEIRRVTK